MTELDQLIAEFKITLDKFEAIASRMEERIAAVKDESASHEADSLCIVRDCVNHRHQGRFIGDLCAPCHAYITTSFLGELQSRVSGD